MFRLAQLICVAAATTASATIAKDSNEIKKDAAAAMKKSKAVIITGSSKVSKSKFSMPVHTTVKQVTKDGKPNKEYATQVPTWKELTEPSSKEDYRIQCHFAGGKFQSTYPQYCLFDKTKTASIHAHLDSPATVSETFDYKQMFSVFGDEGLSTGSTHSKQSGNPIHKSCKTDFNLDAFNKALPTSKKSGYSWSYSWDTVATTSEDQWCFMETKLPSSFKGGLILTHVHDDYVNTAVLVENGIANRYFSQDSLKSNALGKSGKIPLSSAASRISVFMQSTVAASTAKTSTAAVTFTRMSTGNMLELMVNAGGAIVWIIIGVLACLVCTTIICVWRCCKNKEKFNEEDCYIIV